MSRTTVTDWPKLGLVDLMLATDNTGLWYLVPKSERGEDWIVESLQYDGARTFSGGVPVEYEDVGVIRYRAVKDGLSVHVR